MEEEAFLRAISAAPDDSAVRLIYADWLEDQGDPRAEFVRLQVRLREMPVEDPGRPQLQSREQQLRASCPAYWLARLDPPVWCAVGNIVRCTVVVCERATGIVCHPDGRWWLATDSPQTLLVFLSLDEAEAWCQELRSRRPDLECSVRNEAGGLVRRFR